MIVKGENEYMRNNIVSKVLILLMVSFVTLSTLNVEAGSRGSREKELSKNGAVHKERYDEIMSNLGAYAYVDDFTLTRYIPRDATEKGWNNVTSDESGGRYKSVYWQKVSGGWLFSSASAERYEITKDKFAGRKFTESTKNYKGDAKKIVYQMKFSEEVSSTDRDSIMPYKCKASIQYSGDPFSGAFGFVDWGSVAADVNHNGVFKKGAKLFIQGYGKGDVHDVGGGIRGRHLDLFMDNCEEGFAGGKTSNKLVIYEKAKSSISGKPVTKEILDKVMGDKKWGDGGADVDLSGSEEGTGGSTEKGEGHIEGSKREYFDPFRTHKIQSTIVGVDNSESSIPSEASYLFSEVAMTFYKIMQWFMVVLSLGLILFVSLQIAGIVLSSKGNYGLMYNKAGSFLYGKESDGEGMNSYKGMVIRNIILMTVILTLVLGSYYVGVQAKIYYALSQIMGYLF